MTIEEKDFKLTPISEHSPRFDLELLYNVKSRNGNERSEFKVVAYGISLEYAINKIVQYRINNNHKDEAISLTTYFNEFKKEMDSIKMLCTINQS